MKRVDYEFAMLCDEIDEWKAEAEFWKDKYEKVVREHMETINSSIKSSKECIGIMLTAVLDPNSVINKGHQIVLEEKLRKSQKLNTTRQRLKG